MKELNSTPAGNKAVLAIPILLVIISHALVFLGLYFSWFGVADGTGGEFCELAHQGLVKQPSNSFSNFAFAIAGLVAAYQVYKGKFKNNNNPLTRTLFFPIILSSLMILLSPGSMAMHASETTVGGYFDMLSMYLIAAIIFSYAALRFFKLSPLLYTILFVLILVICHIFHFSTWQPPIVGFAGSFIFGVFCILGVLLEILHKIKNKVKSEVYWVVIASVVFLIAFAIWQIGYDTHPWCIPEAIVQAHAIWHILDAVAIYCFFRLYISEDIKKA